MKTLELRLTPRHKFQERDEKYVSLKTSIQDVGNEIQCKVFDVSPCGLGIFISVQNKSYMKNNRTLWITRLQEMSLQHPIHAEVVYIANEVEQRYGKKSRELKVGLKLSGIFPPRIYQDFLKTLGSV